ncbi:MAG: serine kinase [Rhodobiaceae bacterium]|nr:serine kinase [Rhodobiaceae bacterium]
MQSPASVGAAAVTLETLPAFAAGAIAAAASVIHQGIPLETLPLAGLDLSVHGADAAYAVPSRVRLAVRRTGGHATSDAAVLLVSAGQYGFPAPPVLTGTGSHMRAFEAALRDTQLRAEYGFDHRLWNIYDTKKRIGVQWTTAPGALPPWESGAPLRAFLHWFHADAGRRLVHAGTLGLAGRGALLVGKGGSGKSGTVVAGLCHGLESVGDDYVLVDASGGRLRAFPVFETLKQDAAGLRRLGISDAIGMGAGPNWQDKYEFTCRELGKAGLATDLDVRAILVPRLAGEAHATRIEPVSRARAMLALAPSGLFQMPGERDSGVAVFADIVRALPCYSLDLGCDPAEVSGCIAQFLDALP